MKLITKATNRLHVNHTSPRQFHWREQQRSLVLISINSHSSWDFSSNYDLSSITTQRAIMDQLFIKLNLSSLNDWLTVSQQTLKRLGASRLIVIVEEHYSNIIIQIISIHFLRVFIQIIHGISH